jgi:hypothetical protein
MGGEATGKKQRGLGGATMAMVVEQKKRSKPGNHPKTNVYVLLSFYAHLS